MTKANILWPAKATLVITGLPFQVWQLHRLFPACTRGDRAARWAVSDLAMPGEGAAPESDLFCVSGKA